MRYAKYLYTISSIDISFCSKRILSNEDILSSIVFCPLYIVEIRQYNVSVLLYQVQLHLISVRRKNVLPQYLI